MQATAPWEMLPSRQRTRSAPRNWTRFAAQYSARGLPCERFTAALTSRISCITRGRGGWLDLPRGGLAPPILCQLPGALGVGPDSDSCSAAKATHFDPSAEPAAGDRHCIITVRTMPLGSLNRRDWVR